MFEGIRDTYEARVPDQIQQLVSATVTGAAIGAGTGAAAHLFKVAGLPEQPKAEAETYAEREAKRYQNRPRSHHGRAY